jgi:hypothetical protein
MDYNPTQRICSLRLAAAWNADTRHCAHGSRGEGETTLERQSERSGHYLTVRR